MKRVHSIVALVVVAGSFASAPAWSKEAGKQGGEQAVLKVEREWSDAAARGDAEALNRIVSNEYIDTTGDGKINNKAQYVENAKAGAGIFAIQSSGQQVRVYGDTAVVTGQHTLNSTSGGPSLAFRYTSVYVNREGRWQPVASHVSPITQ